MAQYNNPQCKALEEAINALSIPANVEVKNGILTITILGTNLVSLDKSLGLSTIQIVITPGWNNLGNDAP